MQANANSRGAAFSILRAVRNGAPFDRAVSAAVPSLADPDRRLAHEIAAGVLRERRVLDLWIASALHHPEKRLHQDLSDVLRIGAYQLSHLDRVPSYAAVQATVDLARNTCGPRSAPLVNAVLRRLSTQGSSSSVVDAAPIAARYSHPDWLVARWEAEFGMNRTIALLKHNNNKPPLVVQPLRWTADRLANAFTAADIAHTRHASGYGLCVTCSQVDQLPGYEEGAFLVQDPSQRRLLELADVSGASRVWDTCAAPGGKALVLGSGSASIIATERSRYRAKRMMENLARARSPVQLALADAANSPMPAAAFDVVLLDAPCSATGTIARHPDARWRLDTASIERIVEQQTRLLESTFVSVKPGGVLVYLTCSLEQVENQGQIDRFLSIHPEFERAVDDLFFFPPDCGHDGGFGAKLRRIA